jgi:ABC-type dipeptide/oligopeptide/nickel transport system permease subunit
MKTSARPLAVSYAVLGALALVAFTGPLALSLSAGPASTLVGWLAAARNTLLAVAVVTVTSAGIGLLLGAVAALGPWLFDACVSRAVEIAGALPSLVVVVVLRALDPGLGVVALAVVLSVVRGLGTAKVVRAELLELSAEDFVLSSRALGSGRSRLFFTHLLPHVGGPALASAAFTAASFVGLDAAVSFVGFGGPTSFGGLLSSAAREASPALAFGPALGVALTVLPLWIIADALDDRWSAGRRPQ